ncbi:hypothetical protein N7532_010176 [Penicillium argentinense]|uniref:Uncharacterized protein n=1 Tax=Penicillium argentinense TaxID=1131581 RepID=A0A9W9EPD0_9EURO|nr:uncharacterized protein N7532_010176 [Penicillium argentinense]KAJ5085405.1 hypothetical protein N7532_010176 [Penicillium argentinense]
MIRRISQNIALSRSNPALAQRFSEDQIGGGVTSVGDRGSSPRTAWRTCASPGLHLLKLPTPHTNPGLPTLCTRQIARPPRISTRKPTTKPSLAIAVSRLVVQASQPPGGLRLIGPDASEVVRSPDNHPMPPWMARYLNRVDEWHKQG